MPATQLDRVSFIVLRHMRTPILVLICVYAVCLLGMVMVPGPLDENGEVTYMSFFHAYYFLAYTATTTGFGELPMAFSNSQRMWAVICLYVSVVTWLYAVGKIISLVKNPHLQAAIEESNFSRAVRNKSSDFYIVCGFGDTGSLLIRGLDDAGFSAVVLESNPERVKALELRDYRKKVLGLCADAATPRFLQAAGIEKSNCIGILVLSSNEEVNLKVAVSARLLCPELKIICRSTSAENENEILAIGGDTHVVDPFRVFASYLSMIIYNPTLHTLNEWISGTPGFRLDRNICPVHGNWILCGHGRMGRVVYQKLTEKNVAVTVIEPAIENITEITENAILGRANVDTLNKANVKDAVGIIAGTSNDTFNLNMLHTANQLNPHLFSIVRQNSHDDEILFEKANVDFIMQPSLVIARMVLFIIIAPLLKIFFGHLREMFARDQNVLADIMIRLEKEIGGEQPLIKSIVLNQSMASAVCQYFSSGKNISVGDLYRNPENRDEFLKAVPLVHKREDELTILPNADFLLMPDDEILFCMRPSVKNILGANLANEYTLSYLVTGKEASRSNAFRWLEKRRLASGG